MALDADGIFQRLGLALAIGLLVGLERGWKARKEAEGERVAGLRTYALSGLLGGLSALIAIPGSPIFLPIAFAVYAVTMALFHYRAAGDADFSVTSVVASLLTFALGAYAVLGDPKIAGASAVAMTLLLAFKEPLHSWLKHLTWPEIRSFFTLIAMTFLLLPILPSRAIDPWGLIVPAEIWLFAILIAGMSFVGYVAIKAMGPEIGTALAGLAGGLASSTATTLTFARMSREQTSSEQHLAGGVLLAGAVMVARVLIIVTAINAGLLLALIGPLGATCLLLLRWAATFSMAAAGETGEERARSNYYGQSIQSSQRSWAGSIHCRRHGSFSAGCQILRRIGCLCGRCALCDGRCRCHNSVAGAAGISWASDRNHRYRHRNCCGCQYDDQGGHGDGCR